MGNNLTFGQKIGAGYAVMIAFAILIGVVAAYALRATVESKDRVISDNAQALIDAAGLQAAGERRISAVRGYLLSREQRSLDARSAAQRDFGAIQARLQSAADTEVERRLLGTIERASDAYRRVGDELIALARGGASHEAVERVFEEKMFPARDSLDESIRALVAHQQRLLERGTQAASAAAASAVTLLTAMTVLSILFAIVVAVLLARSLGRQIGAAVGHVQSSSAELQAAATQQASGAKQQASAMNEITTTISELVATSRQIAESAQRVSQIAGQTATAARHGEGTVEKGQEATAGMRRQVDAVVTHMLDLNKKSHEIGEVLEIVSELAEQTNILAINATIEASGAGEAGRRFGVVADEIRKLADRVGTSAKEIRGLVDVVRGAVNTTVMATESGAKAVEAGSRQFTEVAVAFKQIAGLVGTTTDAAREIELSTKQQATAAEQVRTAVADAAQATSETEASTAQTLQTASQLASLSRDLLRLVQPRAAKG